MEVKVSRTESLAQLLTSPKTTFPKTSCNASGRRFWAWFGGLPGLGSKQKIVRFSSQWECRGPVGSTKVEGAASAGLRIRPGSSVCSMRHTCQGFQSHKPRKRSLQLSCCERNPWAPRHQRGWEGGHHAMWTEQNI